MSRAVFDEANEFDQRSFLGLSLDPGDEIVGKDFEACRFESCVFQEVELSACSFGDSFFIDCNLSVAKVTNSSFANVVFQRSKLTGVNWTLAHWSAVGSPPTFEMECVVDYSVFLGLKLKNAVFRDCTAHEVDFSEADLSGCDFSGTDLAGARFNHTNLSNARFETAHNYSIDLTSNRLKGARFSLPEAASLLRGTGIEIVGNEP